MFIEVKEIKNEKIAFVKCENKSIKNADDMLDIMGDANYLGANKIVLNKDYLTDDFFDLKTRIAGDILQKFSNYHMKIAIWGDFSIYNSRSLKDFIYECNNGNTVFFSIDENEALSRLL